MQFRSLKAMVGYVKDKPFEGKLWLQFSLETQCPISGCTKWTEEVTPQYQLMLSKGAKEAITAHKNTGESYFGRARFCEHCGVHFQMPKADRERLATFFQEWVTVESIEGLIASLPPFVEFKERLDAAQDHREAVAMEWPEPFQLPLLAAEPEAELAAAV